jgi:hypothetical protein
MSLPWNERRQGSIGLHYECYPALPAIFQIVPWNTDSKDKTSDSLTTHAP